jgi:hypothetical protein
MLLKSGTDKSIRGWEDDTALDAAEDQGHAAVVALLPCRLNRAALRPRRESDDEGVLG